MRPPGPRDSVALLVGEFVVVEATVIAAVRSDRALQARGTGTRASAMWQIGRIDGGMTSALGEAISRVEAELRGRERPERTGPGTRARGAFRRPLPYLGPP